MKSEEVGVVMTDREEIRILRQQLAVVNQLLGDIAGPLYDHDLHDAEDAVLEFIKENSALIKASLERESKA